MAYYSELKFYYDRYDLRYDRGSGRASDCELDKVSKDIRAEYQKLEFLRKCTTHLIGVLAGVKIPRSPDHRPFPRRSDRPNERDALLREHAKLNRWEIEVAEREVGALMRILLQNHSLTKVLLPVQDFFLYRVHHKLTNSLHDPSTGIRCSAWANMLLLDEVGDPNVWSEEVEAREIPRDMIQANGTGGMSGLEGLFSAMSVN
ncbi:hypothetical protein ACMFMG_005610 [Clarireedia jacksonii]